VSSYVVGAAVIVAVILGFTQLRLHIATRHERADVVLASATTVSTYHIETGDYGGVTITGELLRYFDKSTVEIVDANITSVSFPRKGNSGEEKIRLALWVETIARGLAVAEWNGDAVMVGRPRHLLDRDYQEGFCQWASPRSPVVLCFVRRDGEHVQVLLVSLYGQAHRDNTNLEAFRSEVIQVAQSIVFPHR
jgi:hypothetical protein